MIIFPVRYPIFKHTHEECCVAPWRPSLCGRCEPNDAEALKGVAHSSTNDGVTSVQSSSKVGSVLKMVHVLNFPPVCHIIAWVLHHAKCQNGPWAQSSHEPKTLQNFHLCPVSPQIPNWHCGIHYRKLRPIKHLSLWRSQHIWTTCVNQTWFPAFFTYSNATVEYRNRLNQRTLFL